MQTVIWRKKRTIIAGVDVPDGIAVLAGLAVEETQLLERLAENVFAAHLVLERDSVWYVLVQRNKKWYNSSGTLSQWPTTDSRK